MFQLLISFKRVKITNNQSHICSLTKRLSKVELDHMDNGWLAQFFNFVNRHFYYGYYDKSHLIEVFPAFKTTSFKKHHCCIKGFLEEKIGNNF